MTQDDLFTALKVLGMPVAYSHFTESVKPPYITYLFHSSDDLFADNFNAIENGNYQVELYTALKSPDVEELLQAKLKELCLPYQKLETYLGSEKLFQILYLIQLTN